MTLAEDYLDLDGLPSASEREWRQGDSGIRTFVSIQSLIVGRDLTGIAAFA